MDIIVAGPGRAGTALALAASRAGHRIVAVVGRRTETTHAVAERLSAMTLGFAEDLPSADLLVVAVRDDAIDQVAARLTPHAAKVDIAVHLSGLKPAAALAPLAEAGVDTGVIHPLQSLPTPDEGAAALAGAWFAVTAAAPDVAARLDRFVESLGGRPFRLADEHRALYHAAAAVAANDLLAVLALAEDLFTAAEVPFEAARPLVEQVVANAFRFGPRTALTGPIARGDVGTVASQIEAVEAQLPERAEAFRVLARLVADLAGNAETFEDLL